MNTKFISCICSTLWIINVKFFAKTFPIKQTLCRYEKSEICCLSLCFVPILDGRPLVLKRFSTFKKLNNIKGILEDSCNWKIHENTKFRSSGILGGEHTAQTESKNWNIYIGLVPTGKFLFFFVSMLFSPESRTMRAMPPTKGPSFTPRQTGSGAKFLTNLEMYGEK